MDYSTFLPRLGENGGRTDRTHADQSAKIVLATLG